MICPHCAFPNEPGARVCVKCHRSMEISTATPGDTGHMVRRCLEDARAKEQQGDLRDAFLGCQSLLIDHYGDIPDDAMASLYAYMGRISQKQGKPERAAKYLRKARTLNPNDPQLRALVDSAAPAAPSEPAAASTPRPKPPAALPVEQALSRAADEAGPKKAPGPPPPPAGPKPARPAAKPKAPRSTPAGKQEATATTQAEPRLDSDVPGALPGGPPPAVGGPREGAEARPVDPVDQDAVDEEPADEAVGDAPAQPLVAGPAEQAGPVRLAWVAGFWVRAVAFFVDVLLVTFLAVIMMVLSASLLGDGGQGAFAVFAESLTSLAAAATVFVLLLLVYLSLFARYGGQTAGKMLLGLRVVGLDGHSLTTLQAARRAAGMLIAALPGLAGFFWTGFDLERRGWHDRIARTVVVHIQPPRAGQPAGQTAGGQTT